jgi:O-antigen ligase
LPTGLCSAAATAAALAPSLLAYNFSPSPTFLNQALAFALWGAFLLTCAFSADVGPWRRAVHAARLPLLALALLAGAAAWSMTIGPLPSALGLSAIGTMAAAALMLAGGASARGDPDTFAAFAFGLALAGVVNVVIASIQVFAPSLTDGQWIATSAAAGRAVGNLRQPNHVSSVLLWAVVATVALVELRRLAPAFGAALVAALVYGIVLTASRTGMVGIALLAAGALIDRRLQRPARRLLLAAPVVYAVVWGALAVWAHASAHEFYGQQRLSTEGDVSASRFAIWSDTLALIRAQPWYGVGFGVYNFAWSLSVMPHRPVAFFDHAHNLPLHLAAELGVPMATLVTLLLIAALVQAWRRTAPAAGDGGGSAVAGRYAFAMVATISLHSLLEYPLWYAFFLLPAAWAWGYALGAREHERAPGSDRSALVLGLAGALMSLGAVAAVADYLRVVRIYTPAAASLERRIDDGKRSVLFAHHAHHAAATSGDDPAAQLRSFGVSAYYLLDTRLMTAGAQAYAAAGDLDRARHLADRLREFRNPASEAFFAPCDEPEATAPRPFQCAPPSRPLGWRDFLPR